MLEEGNATERVLPEQPVSAVEHHAGCSARSQIHLSCPRLKLDQLITWKPEPYLQISHSTLCSPFKNVQTLLLENIFIDYLK